MELGAFSMSLAVKDLEERRRSRQPDGDGQGR
jgi:hypothetical protein